MLYVSSQGSETERPLRNRMLSVMRPRRCPLALVILICASCHGSAAQATPSRPRNAHAASIRTANAEMAEAVRREFLHAWNGYKRYAWGHDELKPLSKSYRDWYATSLYMTPVDALDTMIVMGLDAEAKKTREFIVEN